MWIFWWKRKQTGYHTQQGNEIQYKHNLFINLLLIKEW